MKRPSSFSTVRWLLIVLLILGILLASISFLSFETVAGWLNGLAADGNFESFTAERYQALSRLFGLLGLLSTIIPALALLRWGHTQKLLGTLGNQITEFMGALRKDARIFFQGLSLSALSRVEQWLLLGLVLAALSIRLANLYIPLTHDEAYTYNAFASRSLWVAVSDYHLPNNHVLLTIIINVLTHLFGNALWLIRLPTFIVGILVVPAAYVLGRRWYGREAGLLGAGLVTVFPILVEYSVLARGYIFVILFTLLILIFGDIVRGTKNRFAWVLLILTNALGFYTIPIMLFPFGALYIWLFLSCVIGDFSGYRSKFDFLKYWLVSGFASAFLTVLFYAPILINDSANLFGNSFVLPVKKSLFPEVFAARMKLAWFEWMHTIPEWLVMVGVAGFVLSILLHFKISSPKIPLQLTFFLWVGAYIIARRPDMMTRMWLYLAAPLLIWSAGGIVGTLQLLSRLFHDRFPLTRVFLGISLSAVFLFGVFNTFSIPSRWSQKSSVESAAIYFKENLQEGDLVTASVEYFPQLRYYFGIFEVDQDYLRKSGYFQRAFIVMGDEPRESLEDVVPMMGRKSNRPAVNMDTLRVVLDLGDLTVYEGEPAP